MSTHILTTWISTLADILPNVLCPRNFSEPFESYGQQDISHPTLTTEHIALKNKVLIPHNHCILAPKET